MAGAGTGTGPRAGGRRARPLPARHVAVIDAVQCRGHPAVENPFGVVGDLTGQPRAPSSGIGSTASTAVTQPGSDEADQT